MTTPTSSSATVLLGELARSARTGALRALSPVESAWRSLRGRRELPPLWLRRHVGPLRHFETAARDMAVFLGERGLVEPGDLVVDLGCGCGAMAPALGAAVGPEGGYLGVDVHRPSVEWCRRRWRSDPRFRFEHAGVPSPYAVPGGSQHGDGTLEQGSFRVPADDASAGLVLAKSLFTHLLEDEAGSYLAETRRLLVPGRRAVVTAFLFADPPAAFPHGDGPVRHRLASRPHAAVAYHRPRFESMIADAGLAVAELVPGFWPGIDRPPRGQDVLVLEEQPRT